MINNKILACVAIAAVALLSACSGKGAKDGANTKPVSTDSGINTYGAGNGSLGNGSDAALSAQLAAQHSVFFDYDSSEMKPEGQAVVSIWAKYLTTHPTSKARLEGNTDERGTREYNIALGERRANTVAQALQAQGVSAQQVSVVSYGEERPVALGHDEDSYAQNRRVDLVQQ
ncbi:MAG: pal [Nevskia sp.]|nr:pal [Nevskia sp.]